MAVEDSVAIGGRSVCKGDSTTFGDRLWRGMQRLYHELLELRRKEPVLRRQDRRKMKAESLAKDILVVFFWDGTERRLLVANFGDDTSLDISRYTAEIGPGSWRSIIDTNDQRFGGNGRQANLQDNTLKVAARCATLLGLNT